MSTEGYLLIADITGYTAYLSQSELEHAEDSLRSLLEILIEHTRPPLRVSRLEGDAVISYALQDSFLQGQTLVEMIENCYIAFRDARQDMVLNTTCTCNACRNIPNLDLKFLGHFGKFAMQHLGEHIELVGSDVNLAHRLLKNHVIEQTGIHAYAAYTLAAVGALGIEELAAEMVPHLEAYEHLGSVQVYVQDLAVVWERHLASRRVLVESSQALLTLEQDFPLEPALLWDYLTKPECRAILYGADSMKVVGRMNGRIGPGATYHCAHGKEVIIQKIVDWQPFDHYTTEDRTLPGVVHPITLRLIPLADGTRLAISFGKAKGPRLPRMLSDRGMQKFIRDQMPQRVQAFRQRIERDLGASQLISPPPD